MSLSIVTVTHRSRAHAARYVETFLTSGSGRNKILIEFVIVENSGDDEIEDVFQPLRDAGFAVNFIQTDNRGFGAGCNAGAAIARHEVLIFANPDIEFLDPIDGITRLAGTWGTVAQINARDVIYSFDLLPEKKKLLDELNGLYDRLTPPPMELRDALVPVGSFFCVDRALFESAGGFDERIFLYHEEAELARRLHALAGPPIYLEEIAVRHRAFGSQQSSRSTFMHETEGLFAYAAITGQRRVLFMRAAMVLLFAPFSATARLRLAAFVKRLFGAFPEGQPVIEPARKTILVLAYSISPVRGSEYSVGWNYVTNMARDHDLIVLYGLAGDHMGDFEEMAGVEVPGITFVPVAPDWIANLLNAPNRAGRWVFTFYLAYQRWHHLAYRTARAICQDRPVDVVHYLCPIGYREPGYLWKLGKPYIWGPIGGMNLRPVRQFFALNAREGIKTALRNTLNWIQFRGSLRLRRALRNVDVLLANTSQNADLLHKVHGVSSEVFPENAIGEIDALPKVATPSHEPLRILWVGRLDTAKALDLLLMALAPIPPELWRLDVVGVGYRRGELEQIARALGLEASVNWRGGLPRAEVADFYRAADVHVLSSLAEGTATVIWEAMAHHVPAITFDHCGMLDNVCDNCGIRVPLGDIAEMTNGLRQALLGLIERREEVSRLIGGSWECAERYSWEPRRRFWDAAYDRAIEHRALGSKG